MSSWPLDPPSPLWAELSRERFSADPLSGSTGADAVVVGGGIAGLSTALALRERGLVVMLLEAARIGWGASGRANGQVIATLTRHSPRAMAAAEGPAFLDMVSASADALYALVARFRIECDAVRRGWLQPAHSPGRARRAVHLAQQWADAGAPAVALNAGEMAARIGAAGYFGGWEHLGGGHINPYAFTLGLARGVAAEGVRIHERTPATSLRRDGDGWIVETPSGAVRAGRVALATAAHTGDLWPGLARTVVPVTSYQAATEPLGDLGRGILAGDEAFSDTRQDLRYMRKDRDGRLVSGSALALQFAAERRVPEHVRGRLAALFPDIEAVRMTHLWGGQIAMTTDRLPHLHRTGDGLAAWLGCNGRGLALACAMGPVLADAAMGRPDAELALRPRPLAAVPFHGFVARTARMILPYYRWRDGREIAGGQNPSSPPDC